MYFVLIGQIPAGAKAMTAEQMAGKMPPGKPVSFLAMQVCELRVHITSTNLLIER